MKMMKTMILALSPAVLYSLYAYRLSAFLLILVSVVTAVAAEGLFQLIFKRPVKIKDLSAVVTGLLFALSLSPTIPLYVAAAGAAFGIIFGKEAFGGFGKNILNPALFGRLFIIYAFPGTMTPWLSRIDGVTVSTPLQIFRNTGETTGVIDLFLGAVPGSIGEMSALLLLAGASYLIYKKYANWRIPASCLTVVFMLSIIAGYNPFFHIFSGSLILGAFFMATDPVTSPKTDSGRYIFGALVGFFIMAMRFWGWLPEGTTFAILGMNIFVPLITKYTQIYEKKRRQQTAEA